MSSEWQVGGSYSPGVCNQISKCNNEDSCD